MSEGLGRERAMQPAMQSLGGFTAPLMCECIRLARCFRHACSRLGCGFRREHRNDKNLRRDWRRERRFRREGGSEQRTGDSQRWHGSSSAVLLRRPSFDLGDRGVKSDRPRRWCVPPTGAGVEPTWRDVAPGIRNPLGAMRQARRAAHWRGRASLRTVARSVGSTAKAAL